MDEFGNAQAAMKMDGFFSNTLAKSDPEVAAAIGDELVRQQDQIEMIASENIVSTAVMEAQGPLGFHNRSADNVFRGNHFDLILLAHQFITDRRSHFGITFRQSIAEKTVHFHRSLRITKFIHLSSPQKYAVPQTTS